MHAEQLLQDGWTEADEEWRKGMVDDLNCQDPEDQEPGVEDAERGSSDERDFVDVQEDINRDERSKDESDWVDVSHQGVYRERIIIVTDL